MCYSLINVRKIDGNKVDGSWIQDVFGDIDDAKMRAIGTKGANSNRITIAITEAICSSTPWPEPRYGLVAIEIV